MSILPISMAQRLEASMPLPGHEATHTDLKAGWAYGSTIIEVALDWSGLVVSDTVTISERGERSTSTTINDFDRIAHTIRSHRALQIADTLVALRSLARLELRAQASTLDHAIPPWIFAG